MSERPPVKSFSFFYDSRSCKIFLSHAFHIICSTFNMLCSFSKAATKREYANILYIYEDGFSVKEIEYSCYRDQTYGLQENNVIKLINYVDKLNFMSHQPSLNQGLALPYILGHLDRTHLQIRLVAN